MTKARTLADLLDSSGDVKSSALDNATSSLSDLSVTATATELNTLDGITATTAELNLMDGVTATTTEINYLDGVTSNVQTQIDGISSEVVDDTTPQLGGNLDVNGNEITSASNGDVTINPNGTGDIILDANVGIGTTAPSYTVDVASSGNTQMHLKASGQADGLEIGQLSADGGSAITATNNNYLKFGTNNTERMRIDSSGNVGIATTSVSTLGSNINTVQINGKNTSNAGGLRLRSTDNSVDSAFWAIDTATYLGAVSSNPLHLRTNNTDRLIINADGSWGKAPAGTVLQVVQDVESNTQSYTGTGESTILSATITPKSSSSKILILCTTHINSKHGYRYAYGKLYRGSSNVFNGNSSGSRKPVTIGGGGNSDGYDRYLLHGQSFEVLDSPATTSAITYYVKMGNSYYNTTTYNNRSSEDTNASYSQRGASSLILMEIAG